MASIVGGCYIAGMPIYVFWPDGDRSTLGFTADQAGANLPPDLAPWRSYGATGLVAGFEAGAFPGVEAEVEARGFCVVRPEKAA